MVLFKAIRSEPLKVSQDDVGYSTHISGGESLKGMCT